MLSTSNLSHGELIIGNNTGMSNVAITCKTKVEIGNHVMIGAGVRIYDMDFHPLESKYRYGSGKDDSHIRTAPIRIDDGVFIGTGSVILKGVEIGRNSIVGAGSVVSKSIPEGEIWAGNPAKRIKSVE